MSKTEVVYYDRDTYDVMVPLERLPEKCEGLIKIGKVLEDVGFKVTSAVARYREGELRDCTIYFVQPDIYRYRKELGKELILESHISYDVRDNTYEVSGRLYIHRDELYEREIGYHILYELSNKDLSSEVKIGFGVRPNNIYKIDLYVNGLTNERAVLYTLLDGLFYEFVDMNEVERYIKKYNL